MLDKMEKRACKAVSITLAVSLDPLDHCQNGGSLSLSFRYYFGRCLSEPAGLVPLPYYLWKSALYSDIFQDFLSPFLDVIKISMSTVSFLIKLVFL